jgi:hypothetical protein
LDDSLLKHLEFVDLKAVPRLLEQYVDLRNKYSSDLLSEPVEMKNTENWLSTANIKVICAVAEKTLQGVAILYFDKGGELAFFSRTPGKGTGSCLLVEADKSALSKGLGRIWAWTAKTNQSAQSSFIKSGYSAVEETERKFRSMSILGIIFEKHLK